MKKRVGIIGLGRIGHSLGSDSKREQPASHSKAYSENEFFMLSGGFDIDEEKRVAWKKAYPSAKVYPDLETMLSDGRWDVIVIAVPEEAHESVFRRVVFAKPSLIVTEKPVAANLRPAKRMLRLAKKTGLAVQVNHERRFSKDYLFVRGLISSKRFGNLRFANLQLITAAAAVKKNDRKLGQGSLIHDGTHLLDIFSFLTGSPLRISSVLSTKKEDGSISGVSALGSCGGSVFSMHIGYRTKAFEFELELNFEKGRVRIGNGILEIFEAMESPFYEGFYSLFQVDGSQVYPTEYFSGMVQNCADYLSGQAALVSPLEDGIAALKVISQIRKKV